MSSIDEYKGSLGLPREFTFENGLRMVRLPTPTIGDGFVMWVWKSESGDTVVTYTFPANDGFDEALGRVVTLSTNGAVAPPQATLDLAETIFPDEQTHAEGQFRQKDPQWSFGLACAPKMVRASFARFPGMN